MQENRPFRVCLSCDHANKVEHFRAKEQMMAYMLDTLESIGEGHFQLLITRQRQEAEEKDEGELIGSSSYDLQLMREQLLLFDREEEMVNYVQTEKILANDPIKQLTDFSICLLRLSKLLLLQRKPLLPLTFKEQSISRQKLDRIESQCLNTLMRVREQRKRVQNCCVCLSIRSSVVVMPCMHLVLCVQCGRGLSKCPICSQPISQMREVFQ